jgi:hypothetical protein
LLSQQQQHAELRTVEDPVAQAALSGRLQEYTIYKKLMKQLREQWQKSLQSE